MADKIISIPLYTDEINPTQYKWLCSLFKEQTKQIVDESEEQIRQIKAEREEKLKELNTAQTAISDIFLKNYQACLKCRGTGTITEYNHMHDDRGHSVKCEKCRGQGYLMRGDV